MANFLTRVVLHNAGSETEIYELLHLYMEAAGFTRQIPIDAEYWDLPDAMYDYRTDDETITTKLVRDKAKVAAAQTKKKYTILTVRYSAVSATNLEKAADT